MSSCQASGSGERYVDEASPDVSLLFPRIPHAHGDRLANRSAAVRPNPAMSRPLARKAPSHRWASRRVPLPASSQPKLTPSPCRPRITPARLLHTLTAEPHVAGTPADYKTAVFVRDKLREWGWKADIAEIEVLLNYPGRARQLSRSIGPSRRRSRSMKHPSPPTKIRPAPRPSAPFTATASRASPAGQVVYANFGRPEDFEALEKMGIDVKGKIVLVRYGGLFRGLKVRNAQTRGAAGILIFSDPADDGFAKGDIYPDGPFRPASAIQRGSVQFLSLGPGDPSTPFGPSVKGAKRLPFDRSENGIHARVTTGA